MLIFPLIRAKPPATYAYVTRVNDNTRGQTSYTFTSASLGAAASNRVIVVTIYGRASTSSGRSVSAVTIGGVSATQAVTETANNNFMTAIWYAAVPSGTTGNIVVTWSGGNMENTVVDIHRTTGISGAPVDTDTSAVNPMSETINVSAGGLCIGIYAEETSATYTWTGITEVADGVPDFNGVTSAGDAFATAQTGLSVTCTPSVGAANYSGCLAAW